MRKEEGWQRGSPSLQQFLKKRENNTQLAKRNLNHSYDSHSDQINPVWICTVLLA